MTEEYKEYLNSIEWKNKREQVLKRDKYKCKRCANNVNLHVHHGTYARIFKENLDDLFTLCIGCHELYHKENTVSIKSTTSFIKKYKKTIVRAVNKKLDTKPLRVRKKNSAAISFNKQTNQEIDNLNKLLETGKISKSYMQEKLKRIDAFYTYSSKNTQKYFIPSETKKQKRRRLKNLNINNHANKRRINKRLS